MLKWLPAVLEERCTGCALCIEACDSECLEMDRRLAVLSSSDSCGSDAECVEVCADGAMEMRWVELEGDPAVGRWSETAEEEPSATRRSA
jgi:uncharacterized Fe-S center protein